MFSIIVSSSWASAKNYLHYLCTITGTVEDYKLTFIKIGTKEAVSSSMQSYVNYEMFGWGHEDLGNWKFETPVVLSGQYSAPNHMVDSITRDQCAKSKNVFLLVRS